MAVHRTAGSERRGGSATAVPRHLATTPREFAVTEFEQALIVAAEGFYRFYGSLLGREGRLMGISGYDNVILQQVIAASRPLSVADIARFANRDDIANIQYSLKKLIRGGLIRKASNTSARETAYVPTELARGWMVEFLHLRRELFTAPSADIKDLREQLRSSAKLLNTVTGLYDYGTRVMAAREQMAPQISAKPKKGKEASFIGGVHR